jgi:hypothetical protein
MSEFSIYCHQWLPIVDQIASKLFFYKQCMDFDILVLYKAKNKKIIISNLHNLNLFMIDVFMSK